MSRLLWRASTALTLALLVSFVVPYAVIVRQPETGLSGSSTLFTPVPSLYSSVFSTEDGTCVEGEPVHPCRTGVTVRAAAAAANLLIDFSVFFLLLSAFHRIRRTNKEVQE